MMSFLRSTVRGFIAVIIGTVVLGMAYPCVMWAVSRINADAAEGHLIYDGDCLVAAHGLADGRPDDAWFQSRAEGATNLSPLDPQLNKDYESRRQEIAAREHVAPEQVPLDAVSGSGSGADDGISPAYAELQVPRVARAHGLSEEEVRRLVSEHTAGRIIGVLGDPVVHVTDLNAALPGGTTCPAVE
ncbi:potassium-transporting ATPase subunit C [Corynebacterium uropygiale]|uniref:Potassium-transporting ATPase subunit C n=1 Tax=Corynebacterium uropygiale TaxID=1775911 RepID=A0A9X1QSS2_9CORY|nr:potassium-transporting ATPase subunit C [Corynebacterium uropygiale]MCF4007727.1 potassium-transporting ATPase subunit C [Corynebacterium uropygiale]